MLTARSARGGCAAHTATIPGLQPFMRQRHAHSLSFTRQELARCSTIEEYIQAAQHKSAAQSQPLCAKMLTDEGGKGRGLVATQELSGGEIVLSERAVVFIRDRDGDNVANAKAFALAVDDAVRPLVSDGHNSFAGIDLLKMFGVDDVEELGVTVAGSAEETVAHLNHLLGVYCSNAHQLVGDDGDDGHGWLPALSMMNHSCEPNCQIVGVDTKPNTLQVIAMNDICEGDELTFSYLSEDALEEELAERQGELQDTFMFGCLCARCVDETAASAKKPN